MEPSASQPAQLVGRRDELEVLLSALREAEAGQRRLLLLSGEAGIGKTRLADELAARARSGAAVVWGRCWEGGGAPAYWPWVQVLRELRTAQAAQHGQTGHGAPALLELLDEGQRGAAAPASRDQTARFYLFDAVATFLVEVAEARPLVLIFDDLHAADRVSLLMLQFLARDRRDGRILVIGTYRDREAHRANSVGELVTAIAREGRLLRLGGLQRGDIATFMRGATGRTPAASLVEMVYSTTAGNPFFLDEVVRLLDAYPDASTASRPSSPAPAGGPAHQTMPRIPDEVRSTIHRRLAPLPAEIQEVIAAGAVIGHEFDVALLHPVCERPVEPLLDLLGAAVRDGVLDAVVAHPGRFRFAHALIRDTLYDDLPQALRVRLHRRAGEALEQLGDPDVHLAQLAHHFFQAVPLGDAQTAIAYAIRAGRQALRRLAYEEALAQLERASHIASTVAVDADTRCDLLLDIGQAQAKVGMVRAARATFERAAQMARDLADPVRLGVAALRCGGIVPVEGVVDDHLDALLADAIAAIGERDLPLRCRLLGRRAMGNYYTWPRHQREAMTAEAVEIARATSDDELLASALNARCYALWEPQDVQVRLDASHEIIRLTRMDADPALGLQGRIWRIIALLEHGDIRGADLEISTYTALAEQLREPAVLWQAAAFRAMRALLDGRIHEAETLVARALGMAQRDQDSDDADSSATRLGPNAALCHAVQIFNLRTQQGRLDELEDAVRTLVRDYPALLGWRCALAYLLCRPDPSPEVRVLFEALAANEFQDIPRDGNWIVAIAHLAEVCALLGDKRRAALLHDLLGPLDDLQIVAGNAWVCRGAVSHYLGLLSDTMGAHDEADRHFAAALALHERLGAPIYTAHTRAAWGRAQASRGHHKDAGRLLAEALTSYRAFGLDVLADQVAGWLEHAGAAPAAHAAMTPGQTVLRREGEYWAVEFEGRTSRLRHSKGLGYLIELLRRPGQELHALDLVAGTGTGATVSASDLGPLSDPEARRAYRARIADLEEEIEEAQRFGDLERAARHKAERDSITHQLAASLGLAGRGRVAGSHAERARLNVTRAIRAAIQRIEASDPALARHLDATIRTGTYCSYTPDPRAPVHWHTDP